MKKWYVIGELRRQPDGTILLVDIGIKSYRARQLTCMDGIMWCDFGEPHEGPDAYDEAKKDADHWKEWLRLGMSRFEIWHQGYRATGESQPHGKLGMTWGTDFKDACRRFFSRRDDKSYFDAERNTYWERTLYPTEAEARAQPIDFKPVTFKVTV